MGLINWSLWGFINHQSYVNIGWTQFPFYFKQKPLPVLSKCQCKCLEALPVLFGRWSPGISSISWFVLQEKHVEHHEPEYVLEMPEGFLGLFLQQ